MALYSAQLLDHFEHPRNAGEVEDAEVRVRVENPACGDVLELSARTRGRIIEAIKFRAKGCVPAMACGSLVTALAVGKTVDQAKRISKSMIEIEVGGLPPASGHAAQLAADAMRALLKKAAEND